MPRSPEKIEASLRHRQEYIRRWKAAEYNRDRDRVLARRRVWLANNVDRVKLIEAKKRRRRKEAVTLPFTVDQLAQKIAYWGGKCWICRAPWEALDHVKPLARGGIHALSNLRPICRSCNSRKGARWPVSTSPRSPIMPFIRYTYAPDVARYGDKPIQVEDVEVRVLTEMRRAEVVGPDELEELRKADLQQMADDAGADVPARATRKQIVEALTTPEGSR